MSVKKEMLTGVLWSSVEKYSGLLISIVISSILARLIAPSEFGVVAIATVLLTFLNIFTDLGIGPAIIQRKELTEENLNSIFTFSIVLGIVLTLLFYFSSTFIADFYNNTQLVLVCKVLSLKLLFSSLNVVPQATLLKNKMFKKIAKRTLFFNIFSGAISVYAAFNGAGIYALLITPIVTSLGMLIYNLRIYPRFIDFKMDLSPLKLIFSYSIFQFLFSLMNFFSRNLDSLIIGKYFPIRELGFYEKSYRLMMLPLQNVTHVITPVIQPVFSSMQDDLSSMSTKYCSILKLVATISFPLSIFLFFTGKEIIQIMYGPNWDQAIPIFTILALSLSLQMLLSTSGSIYQSSNATRWMFFNGVINTACTVAGFLIAAFVFKSILAIAWSWNVTLLVNFIVSFFILFRVVLKSSFLLIFKPLFIPIVIAVSCFFILVNIDPLLHFYDFFNAIIKFGIVLVVSFLIIQFSGHYDIYSLFRKKITR